MAPVKGVLQNKDAPLGEGSSSGPAPGAKTPRKVQWLDGEKGSDTPTGSTHALDEHGLDPDAFETLTDALERHQSVDSPHRPIHYFPPRPAHLPPLDTHHTTQYQRDPRHSLALSTGTTASAESSNPPTRLHSPTRDVPGTFIGRDENSGLPGTRDVDDVAKEEAHNIVRAHTGGKRRFFGFGSGPRKPKKPALGAAHRSGRSSGVKTRDYGNSEFERLADSDVERDAAQNHNSGPAMGGGVLSALLALYNEDQLPSGMTTPSSVTTLTDPPDRPWVEHYPHQQSGSPRGELSSGDHDRTRTERNVWSTSPSPTDTMSSGRDPIGRSNKSPSLASLTSRFVAARPPKERNAGGVIGTLIASTGNITGAAAPIQSTLQPNLKRPGYHLSRYSHETTMPTVHSSKHRPTKSLDRPKSLNFEMSRMFSKGYEGIDTPALPADAHTLSQEPTAMTPGGGNHKKKWTGVLKDFPYATSVMSMGGKSTKSTPTTTPTMDRDEWIDERTASAAEREKKRKRRKKAEVFITRHVAEIVRRQEFILKFARAMMMFGGPSHRLQAQIQSTARVLDVEVSCMYLPDVILISFDDSSTGTSNIKFIRQSSALDLGKLSAAYLLYWKVIHDDLSVSEASTELDTLMRKPQIYNWWQLILIGGMCSASICTIAFSGSFIDALAAFPLGALLIGIQLLSVRNELYSNVFEITVSTLFSFVAAALASTGHLCYSAIASSSVVLILPGFIVLCGSLEIMSRNIVAGSVRMCYAVVYSLFLGFGLAMGARAYEKIIGKTIIGTTDYTCSESHNADGAWYQRTPSLYWAFLTVPMYSLFLSLRNQAPWKSKEMPLLVAIASIGWVSNHFVGTKFVNQNDFSAAVGAFAVGVVANVYARFFSGNAFVVMITGILFQLPSGLGNNGLLGFVSQTSSGSSTATSYLSGFQTGLQLISVAIGLTVGLGISLYIVHPIQSRRRQGGVFSL